MLRRDPVEVAAIGRLDGGSGCGVGRGGCRRIGCRSDNDVRRRVGQQHRAELKLRRRLDAVERRLVGCAGNRDDDVVAERRDLGLGDTGGIDALPDDRDRLLELFGADIRRFIDQRRQDHLRAAGEVERELERGLVATR